jgi:hypothetical protein
VLLFRAAWPRAAHCAPHIGHRIQEAVLLTHFSEPGQNFDYGGRTDLRTGNTEALARTISERIGCAVYRIGAADSYPEGYDETVARNVREQDANARPAIAEGLAVRGEEVSDAGARIEAWLRRSGLAPLSRYERFTGGVTGLPIRNAGILWDS